MLNEIIDRTCARMNGMKLEEYIPVESSDEEIPDALRLRLHDDVLKSVEQELVKLVTAKESKREAAVQLCNTDLRGRV
jgi:hypothetical protein